MLSELQTKDKVVGLKQSRRAVTEGNAVKVFLADDASRHIREEIEALCLVNDVPVESVMLMSELGDACGIDVGTAVAALTKGE